jgi:hypothetical protein
VLQVKHNAKKKDSGHLLKTGRQPLPFFVLQDGIAVKR